jgi:transaldolase
MAIKKLRKLKQSIWVDHLSREYLENGGLESHINKGVSGVTSNPSILYQAIQSAAYDKEISEMACQGKDSLDVYEEIIRREVSVAANLLRPVYLSTNKLDGYVSVEVDPAFAHRIDETLYQAAFLFSMLDLPNLMIKVPGTDAGIEAFKELIFDGINVNVTLLFSVEQYEKVARAYVEALEARQRDGKDLEIASVASFFISRIDVAVNNQIHGEIEKEKLRGKAAIASACLAYEKWYEVFHEPQFVRLRKLGARPQRLLWASTGNKYPQEDPLKYVTNLIAPTTVNTLPLKTLDSIIECKAQLSDKLLSYPSFCAQEILDKLRGQRIDIKDVADELLENGIRSFADYFDELMSCLYYRVLEERGGNASRNSESRYGLVQYSEHARS